MKHLLLILWLLILLILAIIQYGSTQIQVLQWSDEFNKPYLDTRKWQINTEYRHHAVNSAKHIRVEGGQLVVSIESINGIHYTGFISTEHKFESVYGYWEARIKFNDQVCTWSDFWLYHHTVSYMNYMLGDSGTEIDIIEHRAFDESNQPIPSWGMHTLHWENYQNRDCRFIKDKKLDDGFHIYGLEWTEKSYKFYIDNELTWEVNKGLTHRPLFIILSTEIRNNFWAGYLQEPKYNKVDTMIVDYIRYYK